MTGKRAFGVSVLLSGLALGGFGVWRLNHGDSTSAKSEGAIQINRTARSVAVEMVGVERAPVSEKISVTGALKPKEQVDVVSKATGRVQSVYVRVGDRVEAGVLLARLEDDELQQQVSRAEAARAVATASLAQREAELSNAKAMLSRSRELISNGLIPHQEFETRQTEHVVVEAQVRLAKAQVAQADAELRELRIRLSQAEILAPMAGHIAQRYVDSGALVTTTTPIVKIVNLEVLVVQASVPEQHVSKLRLGNRAVVQVDAYSQESFTGHVARIYPVLDAATRSANLEIEIRNHGGRLKGEMFTRVELDLSTTRQAVLIPREALVYRGQQAGVFLVEAGQPAFLPIETGMTELDRVEVLSGLTPGTMVVGRGASMIAEGDLVVVAQGVERPS